MTLRNLIRRMAGRMTGLGTDEVIGYDRGPVGRLCNKLAARGELHRAKLGHKEVRFFTNPVFRDAFMMEVEAARKEQAAAMHAAALADDGRRAPWPDDAPVVVPDHVIVVRCPSFEPRFEAFEPQGLYGGNQRGRVTARDVQMAQQGLSL